MDVRRGSCEFVCFSALSSMSSECSWSLFVMLCFILATGAHGEAVCSVRSSAGGEVLLGSNFTISCIFKKECTKQIFQNMEPIGYKQFPSSSEVSVHVKNLTKLSTFICKCKEDPEPCGIDITPGYPPGIPQNLTCIRKTKFGNVSCTWTTGRDTKILTTCQLRVQGDPQLGYKSEMNSTGFCWSTFPIKSSLKSQIIVSLNVSNSLGSQISGPHTFTLSNIVKPSVPKISNVDCSSRWCHLHTDNHSMDLVEIQYTAAHGIWKELQTKAKTNLTISSLQPDIMYTFQIRRKINHSVGLWSDWSPAKEAKTEEEAPDKIPDIWYLQEPKQSGKKCFRIFWKELNASDAKGKIQRYNISVLEQKKKRPPVIIFPPSRNERVCCSQCSVSVSAVNSKGQSPDKFIQLRSPDLVSGFLPQPHKLLNNHSIALSWQWPVTAGHRTEYVVHWYPVGDIERIQWIRVLDTKVNITGLQPHECYQGAISALHSTGPKMSSFRDISTWQSAPEEGPDPQLDKMSKGLLVKWPEIPQEKRRGCLKNYTIHLMDRSTRKNQSYSVDYPKRQYIISNLSPGRDYSLWVSAWTDAGEGPRGNELRFSTQSDAEEPLSFVISIGGAVLLTCLLILCICQFSSVHRRFLNYCKCLLPTVIPDPANSKCAKTYTDDEGEIKFYIHQYDSSMSEEPENVEVEEVPYPSFTCTYIKSFSQESASSDTTQITRTTDFTEDYISTHGAISGGEDEEEEAGLDEFEFLPSTHSPFLEPLVSIEGKLTLDIVKIDCSEFLDCT